MTRGKKQLVCASIFQVLRRKGQSGLVMSELLPHLSTVADDICLIKSTLHRRHQSRSRRKHSFARAPRCRVERAWASWLSYGLGSMNKDLPDFIVLTSAFWSGKVNVQALYSRSVGKWPFCRPGIRGSRSSRSAIPLLFLSNPGGRSIVKAAEQDAGVRFACQSTANNNNCTGDPGNPNVNGPTGNGISHADVRSGVGRTSATRPSPCMAMYGPEVKKTGSFARNCLLARRMAERNVRFIQLCSTAAGIIIRACRRTCGAKRRTSISRSPRF